MSYPSFYANGQECRLIAREGVVTYDLVVVAVIGGVETGWGGSSEDGSIIAPDFTDADIMAKGGRRGFIVWGTQEAERRAKLHFLPPDPSNKTASVLWNLQMSVHPSADKSSLVVAPAPLP